jgi:isochorismate synthase
VQIVNEHGPYNSSAGKLWHLRTDFKAEGKTNLLQIARTLHPTPAVCGLPKPQALALINKYESAPRSLYAGYLGYLPGDETEPATLYVHLRCACISSANPVLFAGGGIMPDSNPEDEWAETEDKLRVLLPFFTP